MAPVHSDRNLLFGILALQTDFVTRDALIAAMHAWVQDKARSLGQILREQGALSESRHDLLEALVRENLAQHGNDPAKSLAGFTWIDLPQHELEQIADSDLLASLAHVSATFSAEGEYPPTQVPSVGTPTSSGLRFRILRPHAKGGLGEVFVALDSELHREVALKEIQRRFADHPEARTRFLLEAEITGGLEHPGIVPVYGLGHYPDGRPFYAMRFIQGDSLQDAITRLHQADVSGRDPGERALALRGLLGRFVDVCEAVAYAHSRGVLHRDLKPGNVMLGKFGETLVVDWGLAKAVGQTETASDVETPFRPVSAGDSTPTEMGEVVGTPAFMSPEQAAGRIDLLGPGTDVYSLGAILFCLLTGQMPFPKGKVTEVLNKVRAGQFLRPRQVNRSVPVALEAVCLKAMALRLGDRYATPQELAGDVEHWLADGPVTAYREPLPARARRWARRHKPQVAAALTLLLTALVLGGGGAWWLHQQRVTRVAESALRRQQADEAVNLGLTEARLLRDRAKATPLGDVATYREAAAKATAAADVAQAREASDELQEQATTLATELKAEAEAVERDRKLLARLPDVRAPNEVPKFQKNDKGFMVRLADPSADEQFVAAFKEWGLEVDATPVAEALAILQKRPAAVRIEVVVALDEWGTERKRLKKPQAERQHLEDLAVALGETLGPRRRELHEILTRDRLSGERTLGELSRALMPITALTDVVSGQDRNRLRQLARESDTATEPILGLLALTRALRLAGDDPLAERLLRSATWARPQEVVLHHALGKLLEEQKPPRWREAVECYATARGLRPELGVVLASALISAGRERDGLTLLDRLAHERRDNPWIPFKRGNALYDLGRYPEAEASFREALRLRPNHPEGLNNLGNVLSSQGRYQDAAVIFREILHARADDPDVHNNLGAALYGLERYPEAEVAFRAAIDLKPDLLEAHNNLGATLFAQGLSKKADDELLAAIRINYYSPTPHYNRASLLYNQRRYPEAAVAYRETIRLKPDFPLAHHNLGLVLNQLGRYPEAEAACREALRLQYSFPEAHNNLANALLLQDRYEQAEAACREAIRFKGEYVLAYVTLGKALAAQGQFDKALQAMKRSQELGLKIHGRAFGLTPLAKEIEKMVKEIEKFVEVDHKLAAVLHGEAQLANADEQLLVAIVCQRPHKRLYAAAARFFDDAFAADPRFAANLDQQHRYNAACCAALAAAGQGEDARLLPDKLCHGLRQQALAWLQADLSSYTKLAAGADPRVRDTIRRLLEHWQTDADLVSVREREALAELPEVERVAWDKLWTDVAALLAKTRGKPKEDLAGKNVPPQP
jgi:eukaryotic-like serine/threonine-protein kinase